jgi:hypothetical protein
MGGRRTEGRDIEGRGVDEEMGDDREGGEERVSVSLYIYKYILCI